MSDPFWADVALLLHFDGTNTSTTFTDETGKTMTAVGNAQLDTSQSQFGTASGLFDGTGDAVTTPNATVFNFGTSDFTIEFWVKLGSLSGSHDLITKRASSASFGSFTVLQSSDAISFYCSSNGSSWDIANGQIIKASSAGSGGIFHHVAITRAGTQFRTYFDGVQGAAFVSSAAVFNDTTALSIGACADASESLNGRIDELRITNGLARYTGAGGFTPSLVPFEGAPVGGTHASGSPSMLPRTGAGSRIAAGAAVMLPRAGAGGYGGLGAGVMQVRLGSGFGGTHAGAMVLNPRVASGTGFQNATGAATMELRTAVGTGSSSAVWAITLTAPAPSLVATGTSGNLLTVVLAAPAPQVSVVTINPAIITAALIVPAPQIVTSLLPGSVMSAALAASVPIMAAAGYPAFVLTAALTAPAPYVSGIIVNAVAATFATYVLNTRKQALSSYGSEWNWNSYTVFQGVTLGCNASGVSVLDKQDSDNGTDIDAVVLTGAEGYGSSFHKRVPRIYVSGTFAGDVNFKTITAEGGSRTYALPWNQATGLVQRRVPVGKGPKSRFWQYGIENVNGAAFSINDVMTYPVTLRRRVQ